MRHIELFVCDPHKPVDRSSKTRPIDTNIVLREFMEVDPTPGIRITVTSKAIPGVKTKEFVKAIETANFKTMIGRIYRQVRTAIKSPRYI